MKFGSICSGIEAASVAWGPLGWSANWVAEVDVFPSAVLAHHYPDVPNHGDMLRLPALVAAGNVPAPDVLVGGTPCQAFSVAGRRGSLEDERGALTLAYVELANEIDRKRREVGQPEAIIVWENVPGVLNTKDNAFGCFLGALAGEDCELEPAGKRWTNAGCVFGPERAVAWRILDAQYFGLAQRRRRVFVVASARDGFDPCEILFEFDGLRRDTAPSREARQDAAGNAGPGFEVAGTLDARTNGGGFPGSDGATSRHVIPIPEAGALSTGGGKPGQGTPVIVQTISLRGREGGATAELGGGVATALRASTGGGDKPYILAFSAKDYGADATDDLSPTLRAGGHSESHANAVAIQAQALKEKQPKSQGFGIDDSDVSYTLTSGDRHAVRRLTPRECERLQGFPDDHTLVPYRNKPAADGPRYKALGNSMAVPVMRWIGKRIDHQLNNN
jgi:DNA (cytosine-5)-methyltransferase 1